MKRLKSLALAVVLGLAALGLGAATPALANHAPHHDKEVSATNPDLACEFWVEDKNNLLWESGADVVEVRIVPDPGHDVVLPPNGSHVADAVDEDTTFILTGYTAAGEEIICEVTVKALALTLGAGGDGGAPCVGADCPEPPCEATNSCPPPPCEETNTCPPPDKEKGNEGVGNGEDPPPPGHEINENDGPGTEPGSPGNKGGNENNNGNN